VTGVRQASDGSCTGAPVDLTSGTTYTLAEDDFMVTGCDGHPNFFARATTRDIMDQVLADYITANTPISRRSRHGSISFEPNPGTGNDCPAGSP
jgi:hypothetical protein